MDLTNNKTQMTDSPCIRNCCLDAEDICVGCLRHIDEIIAWRSYNPQEKAEILILCNTRKNAKKSSTYTRST